MELIFLYGPPAAGKHTIASALAEKTGLPLFHNHMVVDIVNGLFEFGTAPFIELREKLWFDTFSVAAAYDRSMIFTFNPESSVRPALIGELFELVISTGGKVIQIQLNCSDDIVESRLNNESRKKFTKLTDVNLYREVKAAGGFDFDFRFTPDIAIDTATVSVAEAVESIAAHLA